MPKWAGGGNGRIGVTGTPRVGERPTEEFREAFETAIREAVASWVFHPAQRITPMTMPDGTIDSERKSIRYAGLAILRFRVESGQEIVE